MVAALASAETLPHVCRGDQALVVGGQRQRWETSPMTFSRFLARLGLATALAVLAPLAIGATPPASAQGMPQVTLTSESVQAFINSYATVKAAAAKIGAKYGVSNDSSDAASAWGAWLTASGAWGELNGLVTPYGFN